MMRAIDAIDRSELRSTIQWWRDAYADVDDADGVDILDDVLLLIDAQSTLPQPSNEPPTGWVSVEDKLPEEHKPVLCIVSGKPRSNITLDEAYQLGSWNYADGWSIDEWPDWEDAAVSWWRELPQPPDRRPPEGEENT